MQPTDALETPMFTLVTGGTVYAPEKLGRRDILIAGLAGLTATLGGSLLPSTLVAVTAGRFGEQRRDSRLVRSFTEGLAPLTIGLLLATGWVLTEPAHRQWGTVPLLLGTLWLMQRTRISPVWPILAGAAAGVAGWV